MSANGFTHLGDSTVFQGRVWDMATADFRAPDGTMFSRDVVRSPGSVGIVPLLATVDGFEVVLISQYRGPFDDEVIEIPAGMRDQPGEEPAAAARRELIEEVGLDSDQIVPIIDMVASPGMTDAMCNIYMALGCREVDNDLQGPEEEHATVLRMPLSDAVAMITAGTINDAKTVIGLLLTERFVAQSAP